MKNVLVVDDIQINRMIVSGIIGEAAKVAFAENGVESVKLFKNARKSGIDFDIIFMDIMMPEVDGYDAVRQIREISMNNKNPWIVIVTSLSDSVSHATAFYDAGANEYIVKPVFPEHILRIIHGR